MASIGTEVLIVLLLLLLNGVFAMSEIAVVSARKARLQQRAESGDANARRALHLAESPERFLATVQVGITLVGTLAGAFGGAAIAEPLADSFESNATLAPYADALAFGLVVAGITYCSLIIGELVPKQIGLNNPERVAGVIAGLSHGGGPDSAPAVRREDGSWLVDGSLSMEEFRDLLDLEERRHESREYHTVGGYVFTRLGHVPVPGEHFEAEGHRIEVVDMDGNRIDKVLVIPATRAMTISGDGSGR